VRYLLAPKYSTKPNFVPLTEEVRSFRVIQQRRLGDWTSNCGIFRKSMIW
jgi:hypothetical protein